MFLSLTNEDLLAEIDIDDLSTTLKFPEGTKCIAHDITIIGDSMGEGKVVFPEDLTIGGNLVLRSVEVEFPDTLKVDGDVTLEDIWGANQGEAILPRVFEIFGKLSVDTEADIIPMSAQSLMCHDLIINNGEMTLKELNPAFPIKLEVQNLVADMSFSCLDVTAASIENVNIVGNASLHKDILDGKEYLSLIGDFNCLGEITIEVDNLDENAPLEMKWS